MKVTIDTLRKLINEELKRKEIQEAKKQDKKDIPDIDEKKKLSVAQALDVIEGATEDADDPEETRWYLTKVGEAFGLEPEEKE
jgi:uncharacterized protein (UPF0147 family)|tara:strand:- start:518 stop:766 length:249 start_codon:yes stop_codon:yes gene_type:complete